MRTIERSRTRGGFTLTELMITVSLIGVLAAIAIPNFMIYQARTRRSEAFTNLSGIALAYKTYYADQGRYPHMGAITLPIPDFGAGQPNLTKMPWTTAQAFFDVVGWRPDGNVLYTYEIASNCGVCTEQTCFTIVAHGNVDGNNGMGAVMYVHPLMDNAGTVLAECPSFLGYSAPIRPGTVTNVYDEPAVYLGSGADFY